MDKKPNHYRSKTTLKNSITATYKQNTGNVSTISVNGYVAMYYVLVMY